MKAGSGGSGGGQCIHGRVFGVNNIKSCLFPLSLLLPAYSSSHITMCEHYHKVWRSVPSPICSRALDAALSSTGPSSRLEREGTGTWREGTRGREVEWRMRGRKAQAG